MLSTSNAFGGTSHPVQGVRFVTQGALSRIIFDLRENTGYQLLPSSDPSTILIGFPALRDLPGNPIWRARIPLIREVAFVNGTGTIIAEVRLSPSGHVHKHTALGSPPRIVVDIAESAADAARPDVKPLAAAAPASQVTPALPAALETANRQGSGEAPEPNKRSKKGKETRSGASAPTSQAVTEPPVVATAPPGPALGTSLPARAATSAEAPDRTGSTAPVPGKSALPAEAARATPEGSRTPLAAEPAKAAPADTTTGGDARAAPLAARRADVATPLPPAGMPAGGRAVGDVARGQGTKASLPALSSAELLGLAEYQWKNGQLEKAQLSYRLFLERFPEYPNNHLIAARLADILRAKRDYFTALEAYVKVVENYPGSEGSLISQMHMAELGVQAPGLLPDRGLPRYYAYHHPLESLRNFMTTYPFSPLADVARFKTGVLLLHRQETEAALEMFQELLGKPLRENLRPEVQEKVRVTLQTMMAEQFSHGHDGDMLQTFFRYKGLLAPDAAVHHDFLFPVAQSYARLGLLPEAQSLLQSQFAAASTPERRMTVGLELTQLLLKRGMLHEAREVWRAIEATVAPETRGSIQLALGKLAWQAGQAQVAAQYLQQGQAFLRTPDERASLFELLARTYAAFGKEDESLQALQQCTEAATAPGPAVLPQAEFCLFRTATLLEGRQQYPQALAAYATLLKKFPQSQYRAQALLYTADIAQKLGNETQARDALTALRDQSKQDVWHKWAADALDEAEWRKQFHERLAEFQNQLGK